MDNVIYSYIDSMSLDQIIHVPTGEEIRVQSCNFANNIVNFCIAHHTNKVHLFGNKYFIEGVINEIEAQEMKQYRENIIEIEVN